MRKNSGFKLIAIFSAIGALLSISSLLTDIKPAYSQGSVSGPAATTTAANLTAAINAHGLLTEKGARWAVTSTPAVSVVATVSRAAGAAGVRHVADCYSWSIANNGTAATPAAVSINVRDGASGAGTIVYSQNVGVSATLGEGNRFAVCGLGIIGSPATAMTIEFSGATTNDFENVALTGFDVQ